MKVLNWTKTMQNVKDQLREAGITQRQLANDLNITQAQVSRYLSAKDQPGVLVCKRLAEILLEDDFFNLAVYDEVEEVSANGGKHTVCVR